MSLMEICPACRYSLRGLPARHACPECGFRYDKDACLVVPRQVGRIIYGVASTAMFLAGLFLWWWGVRGIGPLLSLTIGFIGIVGSVWHLRRCNRFILVSINELRVVDFHAQERVFPMSQIVDAKWSRISGSVTVTAPDGRELTVIPPEFLGSHRRSKLLALVVRQHLAVRSSSTGGLSQGQVNDTTIREADRRTRSVDSQGTGWS